MKLITRDTDYAIRALVRIASEKGKVVSVRDLTEDLNVPRSFSRKILQVLTREGVLRSYKGKGGGFAIEKNPLEITVLDLIEIFQGQFCVMEHVFKKCVCPDLKICELKKRIDMLEQTICKELNKITIDELI